MKQTLVFPRMESKESSVKEGCSITKNDRMCDPRKRGLAWFFPRILMSPGYKTIRKRKIEIKVDVPDPI